MPVMILWDRKQQQRFIEAVERLNAIVGDLEVLLAAKKKRSAAAHKATASRTAAANGSALTVERAVAEAYAAEGGAS